MSLERGFDKEAFFLQKLQNLGITQGLGDDGCILSLGKANEARARATEATHKARVGKRLKAGELIIAMDSFCEGVHFLREWLSPAQCAKKAFLVNASDIIAMGARPAYALLSVGLPRDWGRAEIADFSRGIGEVAGELDIALIGGDTIASRELQIHITMIGKATRHTIYRDKIPPNSLLCYTHSPYPAQSLAKISKELSYLLKNSGKAPYHSGNAPYQRVKASESSPNSSPLPRAHISPKTLQMQTLSQARPQTLPQTLREKSLRAKALRGQKSPKSPRPSPFGRFHTPHLRGGFVLECARFMCGGMDISDGILSEIRRLCAINRLGFAPSAAFSPLHAPHLKGLLQAGEAYEMLFAISPRDLRRIKKRATRYRICIATLGTLTRFRGARLPRARAWH